MAISTYSELQSAIAGWLLRSDLTAVIPDFIALAETRLNRDQRLHIQDAITRADLAVSGHFTTLPADLRSIINVENKVTPVQEVSYLPPAQMDGIRRQRPTGDPLHYTRHGRELEVVPVPIYATTFEIVYHAKVPTLSDAAPTNWLLTAAPDVYLYAALVESAPYLKDDERVALWETQLNTRLDAYRATSDAEQTSGSPLVVRGTVIG